ncbi:MAG: hypothetical protein AAGU26_05830 [bacterium]|jgi:hypothetical protein
MSKYAEGTEVPIDRSQSEIRRIVMNYGATEFMSGEKAGLAVIAFVACGKQVRFSMPLPDPDSPEFRKTPTGRQRSSGATNEAFAQEMRRRWRALALIVKAKLEAVETGIVSFEREFLPYFVLPGGATVADVMIPRLEDAYRGGPMPALIPEKTGGEA